MMIAAMGSTGAGVMSVLFIPRQTQARSVTPTGLMRMETTHKLIVIVTLIARRFGGPQLLFHRQFGILTV